jgi:hypothetical protein
LLLLLTRSPAPSLRHQQLQLHDITNTKIYRANRYVSEKLNDLFMVNMRNGMRGRKLNVEKTEAGKKLLSTSVAELAAKCKRSHSGLWLRMYALLKPAWENGANMGSDLFAGSLEDLEQVKEQLENRLALVDRLPSQNTLEELNALREAWNDVDRYEWHARNAKLKAKSSFVLLLLLSIASVVVATLTGMGTLGGERPDAAGASNLLVAATAANTSATTDAVASTASLDGTGDSIAFGLAVFSTFFASYVAYSNPVQKWKQLKSAALQLRSEIIEFRTRTGPYDYATQTKDAHELRSNILSLRGTVLNRAGITSSTFFVRATPSLYKHGQYETWASLRRRQVQRERRYSTASLAAGSAAVDPELNTFSAFADSADIVDDFYSPMIPSMYIATRLEQTIEFYQGRISPYYWGKTICAVALMLTSAGSAVLASAGLTVWISIVAVIGSSITSWTEFSGTGKKLGRYAGGITTLRGVRLWWETLTTVEQANSVSVNALVQLTEGVINHDAKAWLATNQAGKSLSKAAASAQGK